ncbi:MAG: FxsA family protein [Hyphomicrobiaceae bacterium]
MLIAIPLLEIALLVKVGQWLGFWWTILIVVVTAVVGSSLVHRQGVGTIRRVMAAAASGQPPVDSLLDGLLLIVAGLLMITPGLITDTIGLLLLLPPLRQVLVRKALSKMFVSGEFSVWESGGARRPGRGVAGSRAPAGAGRPVSTRPDRRPTLHRRSR